MGQNNKSQTFTSGFFRRSRRLPESERNEQLLSYGLLLLCFCCLVGRVAGFLSADPVDSIIPIYYAGLRSLIMLRGDYLPERLLTATSSKGLVEMDGNEPSS